MHEPTPAELEPPTFTRHGEQMPAPMRRRPVIRSLDDSGESSESEDSSDDDVDVVARAPVSLCDGAFAGPADVDRDSVPDASDDEDFHVTMLDDKELELAPHDGRCSSEPQSSVPPMSRYPSSGSASPATPAGESRDEVFPHALTRPFPSSHEGGHAGELTLSLPLCDGDLVSHKDEPALSECTLPSDLFGTAADTKSLPSTAAEPSEPNMSYDVCVEVTSAPSDIATALFSMKHAGDGDDTESFGPTSMMGLTELDRAWSTQTDTLPVSKCPRYDESQRPQHAHFTRMRTRR